MAMVLKRRLGRLERALPMEQVNASREIWTQALLTIDKQDLKLICDLLQRGPPYVESELERAEL